MELFGIGTAELIAILLIMLVVAGPKRMIRWAYIFGQYTAKLRSYWAEMMATVQKEFDAADVGITLPKQIPTRNSLSQQMNRSFSSITKPTQDVLNEVKAELQDVKTAAPTPQKVEE